MLNYNRNFEISQEDKTPNYLFCIDQRPYHIINLQTTNTHNSLIFEAEIFWFVKTLGSNFWTRIIVKIISNETKIINFFFLNFEIYSKFENFLFFKENIYIDQFVWHRMEWMLDGGPEGNWIGHAEDCDCWRDLL